MTKGTDEGSQRRGHCSTCGEDRWADVLKHHHERHSDDEAMVYGDTHSFILKCRGCDEVYFQETNTFSEDVQHWQDSSGGWHEEFIERIEHFPPRHRRETPSWTVRVSIFDRVLGALLEDVYGALNANLTVPAAVAMRTALDRFSEALGVDPAKTFSDKLKTLETDGRISRDEAASLAALVDAGSAAVHRGWRPSPSELETMILIIENLFHRSIVLGKAASALAAAVPPKPSRKRKKQK